MTSTITSLLQPGSGISNRLTHVEEAANRAAVTALVSELEKKNPNRGTHSLGKQFDTKVKEKNNEPR